MDSSITICLLADPAHDQRCYNLPTVGEIAAVIPGDGSQAIDSCDIVLHCWNGLLQQISEGHRLYACLHYVLFFPYGEDGWHWDLQMHQPHKDKQRTLSQIHYVAFRLFPHQAEYSALLRGHALFQQYLVDMFTSAEQNRLTFLCANQDRLEL